MVNTLDYLAADPYTRRVMEEQDYAAKNVEFWKNTNTALKDTIATVIAERDNAWTERDNAWTERDNAWNIVAQQAKQIEELKRLAGLN